MHVPILKMLQTLLSNREILEKTMSHGATSSEEYKSYRDGARFKDNAFLDEEEFRIALFLYIDYFEVANPLGTSRKKHKQTAIYWAIYTLNIARLFSPFSLLCFARPTPSKTMVMVKFSALSFRTLFFLSNRAYMLNSWEPLLGAQC